MADKFPRAAPRERSRASDGPSRGVYQRMRREFLANCAAKRQTCWFCGNELNYGLRHGDPRAPTIHHIVPVAVAPQLEFDTTNWTSAHALCNSLGCAGFDPDDEVAVAARDQFMPDTGWPSEPEWMCEP